MKIVIEAGDFQHLWWKTPVVVLTATQDLRLNVGAGDLIYTAVRNKSVQTLRDILERRNPQ